jgi:hypothetical protein
MNTLDERIVRYSDLSKQRDEIDREIQLLSDDLQAELKAALGRLTTGSAPRRVSKARTVRKCSTCGAEGHSARTCSSSLKNQ